MAQPKEWAPVVEPSPAELGRAAVPATPRVQAPEAELSKRAVREPGTPRARAPEAEPSKLRAREGEPLKPKAWAGVVPEIPGASGPEAQSTGPEAQAAMEKPRPRAAAESSTYVGAEALDSSGARGAPQCRAVSAFWDLSLLPVQVFSKGSQKRPDPNRPDYSFWVESPAWQPIAARSLVVTYISASWTRQPYTAGCDPILVRARSLKIRKAVRLSSVDTEISTAGGHPSRGD